MWYSEIVFRILAPFKNVRLTVAIMRLSFFFPTHLHFSFRNGDERKSECLVNRTITFIPT